MDLDEIVHVDSYRDMDELVNFKPDLDHSPDAGTGKSEIESRSNRHLTQSRLQVMHCREILFTPRCSPRAREFPRLLNFFCTTYGCGATGRHTWPIVGFRPIFQYTTYTYWRGPTLQQRVVLEWFYYHASAYWLTRDIDIGILSVRLSISLSVCRPSVRLSITFRYWMKTA